MQIERKRERDRSGSKVFLALNDTRFSEKHFTRFPEESCSQTRTHTHILEEGCMFGGGGRKEK